MCRSSCLIEAYGSSGKYWLLYVGVLTVRCTQIRGYPSSECNRAAKIYLLEKAQKGLKVKVYLATAVGANM
jgi:hypothetical protein